MSRNTKPATLQTLSTTTAQPSRNTQPAITLLQQATIDVTGSTAARNEPAMIVEDSFLVEQKLKVTRLIKALEIMEARLARFESNTSDENSRMTEQLAIFQDKQQRQNTSIQEIMTTTIPALYNDIVNASTASRHRLLQEFKELKDTNIENMLQIVAKLNENTTLTATEATSTVQPNDAAMKISNGIPPYHATILKTNDLKSLGKGTTVKPHWPTKPHENAETIDANDEYDDASDMDSVGNDSIHAVQKHKRNKARFISRSQLAVHSVDHLRGIFQFQPVSLDMKSKKVDTNQLQSRSNCIKQIARSF
jgi:hypothetical protein